MDAIELLATRASNGKLREPAPDADALRTIIEAALRAPDHGLLRPCRVHVIEGTARERLGLVLREALAARDPNAPAEALDKEQRKPLRAPLMLVVSARPRVDPKVPEIEQVMTAATVAHGILLGAHALGYAAMWRTGPAAYDLRVKAAFGLTERDSIVGFLYLGTAALGAPNIARPRMEDVVEPWTGER